MRLPLQWGLVVFLILGLAWAAGPACQSSSGPVGEKAKKFRQGALAELRAAKERFEPLVAPSRRGELEQALVKFLTEMQVKGRHLPCGLGVLDEAGVVLIGGYSDPTSPSGQTVVSNGRNYSQYDKIRQAIRGERNSHFTLYTTEGTVYMICSPLKQAKRPAGAVCLAVFGDSLRKDLGVSEREFAALNFN